MTDRLTLDSSANLIPVYTIRESKRARHVRLKVSAEDGLVVTVPRGFDQTLVPSLLRRRRRWLDRQFARVKEIRRWWAEHPVDELPATIQLAAIDQNWSVEYRNADCSSVRISIREKRTLTIHGNIVDKLACRQALRRWLARHARAELAPWLEVLSDQHDLPYAKAVIKGQKTRWGSCSSRKIINLNYKLLFLDNALVRYVLIHELCHTVHLNHSSRFWELVARLEPEYRNLDKTLGNCWRQIPLWVSR